MSEENQQEFGIHSVYLKDVSFEAPNSPEIFKGQYTPEIQMGLNVETKTLQVAEVEKRHAAEQASRMEEQVKIEREEKARHHEGDAPACDY